MPPRNFSKINVEVAYFSAFLRAEMVFCSGVKAVWTSKNVTLCIIAITLPNVHNLWQTKIFDNNFIVRMLYKDVYWLCCSRCYIWLSMYCVLYFYVHDAFCRRVFKPIWMNEWMNETVRTRPIQEICNKMYINPPKVVCVMPKRKKTLSVHC